MHPLEGIRARLDVVDKQIHSLNSALSMIVNEHPHRVAIKKNDETGKCEAVLENVPTFPLHLAVEAGLITHGLRAILDGLACQLAFKAHLDSGGIGDFDAVCAEVQFPIRIFGPTETPPPGSPRHERVFSWQSGNFKPIGPYLARLERLQPYHFGNDRRKNALWVLNCLNNTDKHRTLVLLVMAVSKTVARITKRPTAVGNTLVLYYDIPHRVFTGVPYENGARIAEFDTDSPGNVQMDLAVSPSVRFGNGCGGVQNCAAMKALTDIRNHVADIVEDFAPEFP